MPGVSTNAKGTIALLSDSEKASTPDSMPSLVVHLAPAGLLAAALLEAEFDARALGIVLAVTIVPDLDVFARFVIPGGHRSVLHTLLIPLVAGVLLYVDTRVRESSAVVDR